MNRFQSSFNAQSEAAQTRRAAMLARIAAWRALEQRAADASAKAKPQFDKRGQLLPRERVARCCWTPARPGCRCVRWPGQRALRAARGATATSESAAVARRTASLPAIRFSPSKHSVKYLY